MIYILNQLNFVWIFKKLLWKRHFPDKKIWFTNVLLLNGSLWVCAYVRASLKCQSFEIFFLLLRACRVQLQQRTTLSYSHSTNKTIFSVRGHAKMTSRFVFDEFVIAERKHLISTLVKVARWLFSGCLWPRFKWATFFGNPWVIGKSWLVYFCDTLGTTVLSPPKIENLVMTSLMDDSMKIVSK